MEAPAVRCVLWNVRTLVLLFFSKRIYIMIEQSMFLLKIPVFFHFSLVFLWFMCYYQNTKTNKGDVAIGQTDVTPC